MYWNLKEKKKRVYQTSGALKTVIFSIFGKIVKNDFSSFSPPPMKSTHELSTKSCFSSPWIYALQDKTKKKGVSGWKVGQTWHWNNCSHAKSTTKIYRHCLQSEFFSFLIWDRQLKFMFQHPTVWFDRKQLKYLSKKLLLYDFLH